MNCCKFSAINLIYLVVKILIDKNFEKNLPYDDFDKLTMI